MRMLLLSAGLAALTAAASPVLADEPRGPLISDEPQQLPSVTVLATRTETRADETPATVTVFTAEQIEAMLATDIKDLVRFEPGVSVVSQPSRFGAALGATGRAGNEGFTIRGLGGDRVLMVVDGVRVPDGFVFGAQSVGRGSYADLDLMRSVEILRGPASALYGSDGVAGAVAFSTKDPADLLRPGESFGARARVGYNSADEGLTTSAMIAGRSGAFSGLLAWTGRDSHETETQGTVGGVGGLRTMANPQETRSDAILLEGVWDIAPGHSLHAGYDWYESKTTTDVLSGRSATVLALLADDETRRSGWNLGWRGDAVLGLDRARATVYAQQAETRQFTFEDRTPAVDRTRDNSFDNEVFGVSADAVRTLGAHRLTLGGDGSRTTQSGVRDGTVPPFGETFPTSAFPETDFTLAGLFVQDEITLLDGALRLIPALRWDSYDLSTADDPLYPGARADQSGDHVSPKLGLVWQATDIVQLFGNWGEGFKAPTPSQVNQFFSNPAFGYTSAPNPNLRPETSRSLEIGARVRDLDLAGGRLSAQLVGFRSDYEDFISQQAVSGSFTPIDPAVFQFVNFTDVEISGVEAKADIWWDNGVSARFAAAYAAGDATSAGVTTALPSIDPVKVVFGLGYDQPAGRFGGQAIVTWSQAKDAADTDGLGCFNANPALGCAVGENFALLDLTAYWNLSDRVTARIGVFNVLDEKYSWWSDLRGVAATSAVLDAWTQPGRNLGLSLALRY
ncbi:MAG: TonB-dependent hemoglobin/transferrin/lactoferrin family receptor [Alphaproteobacteria bacterium]|jgi:hemoglobin/transferrin/lactoferrin receptor protein|nr:TonB-dependent hemoglobin/transferrin/lactoferrin family receptor [Alphaproteobacteria bacterium]MBU2042211.1 TonB-dependent hemoglobin/transferrin/lactoferrin family receptor [Alphaproteobacteria bacterium]MBU2125605.1 TonB-dependent hemoglobin/transferrin/lactoferrin family receptor [Alphaproteobacteria bacterium]MBU2208402.1 TonB-dependent hemoglobin/transferrin/lactoferrin family receptor [Alphaproteobacteria bacterium]MBU2290365.1 TonB-dependent hemoglobin/transferrin/lactoferrin family